MKYAFCLLFCFALMGCKKQQSNSFDIKYVKEEMTEYEVSPQILPIDLLNPTGIVSLDSFLVFVQRHENKILRIFDLEGRKLSDNILSKGNGPDEIVLFTRFNQYYQQNNHSFIWIQSFPNFMGLLDINKSVQNNRVVFERKVNFVSGKSKALFEESNAVFELSDSVFLLTKDPIRSQTIKENPNPFYVKWNYHSNEVYDTIYINDLKDISLENRLIYSAYPAIRPCHKDKIALFYTYMDAIVIIDLNTKKKTKLGLSDNGLNSLLAIEQKNQIHYEAFATDSLIWGLRKDEAAKTILNVYDWDGNFKYKVRLNANVSYCCINEKNKTLYGIDENDQILAYKLDFL